MIDFAFDRHCCGCGACENICPAGAIAMRENAEGFLTPQVDPDRCVRCGACSRVCPYLRKETAGVENPEEMCYAMYGGTAREDVRRSASGGVFPALARAFLAQGGYVCGCIWNDQMQAEHVVSNRTETVERMFHSKYTQSRVGTVYREIGRLLREGRRVLFCGTPCQADALLRCVGHPDGLYVCDLICKGVPSPGVWDAYRAALERRQGARLTDVVLRSKHRYGWNGPVSLYTFADGTTREELFFQLNPYIVGFLDGLYMRPCCYQCGYKGHRHPADLVLGDFWGIDRETFLQSRNEGVSAVMVRTKKGRELLEQVRGQFRCREVSYADMAAKNPSLTAPTPLSPKREAFFAAWDHTPIEANLAAHTDLKSGRKRLIRLLYRTGLFGILKAWKTRHYRG